MEKNVNRLLTYPSIGLVLFILVISGLYPEASQVATNNAMHWLTSHFGWFVELAGIACLGFLLWLAFSKYGHIQLGKEKPTFSNRTFAFMIFSAGVGSSLIFWSIGEPMYYMQAPPLFLDKGSFAADAFLLTYSIFHWGPTGWAIYCLPSIPFAYMFYIRKERCLSLSQLCSDVIGKKQANGLLGYVINLVGIFGTLAAFASSLAVTVGLLSQGIANLWGINNGLVLQAIIIMLFIVALAFVMVIGFNKGISIISNWTVIGAFLFAFFVLLVSKTDFIMQSFVDSLGVLLDHYFRMSFWNDPVQQSGFPQAWTQYYWAWYFAYLIMMGLFITRISRGRTIKQVILYTISMGSLGCATIISVFGGYAVWGQLLGGIPILDWMHQGGVNYAVIETIKSLPYQPVTMIVFLIIEFLLMLTTMSSASIAVSMMTSNKLELNGDPDHKVKLLWATGIGLISFAVFLTGGGIGTIKSLCVIAGFPMVIVYFILIKAFMGWVQADYGDKVRHLQEEESLPEVRLVLDVE